MKRTLIENDGVMPMGLLKWCLDYAKNPKTPPGGVFSAVKAAFIDAAKTDLLDTVDRIYSFRNEYIAHQEKELLDRGSQAGDGGMDPGLEKDLAGRMINPTRIQDLICVSWIAGLCDTKTFSSHTCDTNHCSGKREARPGSL